MVVVVYVFVCICVSGLIARIHAYPSPPAIHPAPINTRRPKHTPPQAIAKYEAVAHSISTSSSLASAASSHDTSSSYHLQSPIDVAWLRVNTSPIKQAGVCLTTHHAFY